jgi:hypothetical protein
MEEFKEGNIMIAKFMNVPKGSHTHFMVEPFTIESYANADDLKYDMSWDWLMPVAVKCFSEQDKVSDNFIFVLNDALLETNIDSLYKAVLKFIKEYFNNNQHYGN